MTAMPTLPPPLPPVEWRADSADPTRLGHAYPRHRRGEALCGARWFELRWARHPVRRCHQCAEALGVPIDP